MSGPALEQRKVTSTAVPRAERAGCQRQPSARLLSMVETKTSSLETTAPALLKLSRMPRWKDWWRAWV